MKEFDNLIEFESGLSSQSAHIPIPRWGRSGGVLWAHMGSKQSFGAFLAGPMAERLHHHTG
jgi:hypothetical protein